MTLPDLFTWSTTLNFEGERREEEVNSIFKLFKFVTLKLGRRGGILLMLPLFSPSLRHEVLVASRKNVSWHLQYL